MQGASSAAGWLRMRLSCHETRKTPKEIRLGKDPFGLSPSPLSTQCARRFAPDCAEGRRSYPCPQARHNRTALAVSSPISPWVICSYPQKLCPWDIIPFLCRDPRQTGLHIRFVCLPRLQLSADAERLPKVIVPSPRDGSDGCTATFSNTRSFGRGRGRVSFRPRLSQNFIVSLHARSGA